MPSTARRAPSPQREAAPLLVGKTVPTSERCELTQGNEPVGLQTLLRPETETRVPYIGTIMRHLRQITGDRQRRNEAIRREILASGIWLTAQQINARQSAPPADRDQPARDWKKSRRIFSVTWDHAEYFAGYQFDVTCQPLPVIRDILAVFGPRYEPWTIAAWFHFPNGWIAGRGNHEGEPVAPMGALDRPDDVLRAVQFMHGGYVA
ncbi:hypothetical protein GCM10011400_58400 [Paraburkholderia caffeinilytica]|uniref:Antitoxin Xre/MbcA/ParS-like toxin-binding domain-containing protein n=1 Tax=Paraburkholderia caffeinilytica TaxID=1761016 RepID=A0ABQ1NAF6_9BURK|nr:hypothetical protein GCM10011400_58400 [Paraburkholderia caffeinilytica]